MRVRSGREKHDVSICKCACHGRSHVVLLEDQCTLQHSYIPAVLPWFTVCLQRLPVAS